MKQQFKIKKAYTSYPSKNTIDASSLSFEDAKNWLLSTANNYKKYGGEIVSQKEDELIVLSDEQEITFSIEND